MNLKGRILTQSREVLARVGVLAGVSFQLNLNPNSFNFFLLLTIFDVENIYRLTGNVSYAERAMLEMKVLFYFMLFFYFFIVINK
jgi:hypothetical protein